MGVVCVAAGVQIISQVQTYITILITFLLMTSLYVLYDFLRALALIKLSGYAKSKQVELVQSALAYNESMKARLERSLSKFGIEETGAEESLQVR